MIRFIFKFFGFIFFVATFGISAIATVAALGFIYPAFDFFNHLQPFLFVGTFASMLLAGLFLRDQTWQALAIAIAATGFLSSAIIVIPEAILGFNKSLAEDESNHQQYKLMTHNLFGKNYDAERIIKAIKQEDPDILAFQEYFPEQRHGLHSLLVKDYPYFAVCIGGKRANIAIYSRLEFDGQSAGKCALDDESRVSRIIAEFKGLDGKPFSVVTTHLDWPVQVSKLDNGDNLAEGVELAFARKKGQYVELGEALDDVSGPLILAADFNSTSWSYALRNFATDNRLKRITHGILTYPNRLYIFGWRNTVPFLSLDHVMSRGGINIYEVKKGDPAGSDHNSIVMRFSVSR